MTLRHTFSAMKLPHQMATMAASRACNLKSAARILKFLLCSLNRLAQRGLQALSSVALKKHLSSHHAKHNVGGACREDECIDRRIHWQGVRSGKIDRDDVCLLA